MEETTRRSRTTRACDICRKKRTKCSGTLPCDHCRLFALECKFTLPQKKRGPQKRNDMSLTQMQVSSAGQAALAERLRTVESLLTGLIMPNQLNSTTQPQPSVVSVSDGRYRTTFVQGTTPGKNSEQHKRPGWKTPTLPKTSPMLSYSQQPPESVDFHDAMANERVVILEDSSNGMITFFGSTMTALTNGMNSAHGNNGILTIQHSIEGFSFNENHQMDILPCSPDLVNYLLNQYFTYVHPYLPMINQTEFLQQLRGKHHTPEFMFLLNSICQVVLSQVYSLSTFGIENVPELQKNFGERARILLGRLFDFVHIYVIQGLILSSVGGVASKWVAYQSVGMAYRQAVELGMHRDTTRVSHPGLNEAMRETRKRTWMCLYFADRYVSLVEGRPMAIQDEDWDTPMITSAADSDANHLIRHVGLWEIIGRVIKYLNAPASTRPSLGDKDAIAVEILEQLDRWFDSLPDCLQRPPPPSRAPEPIYNPNKPDSTWGFHHTMFCHYHTARILAERLRAGTHTEASLTHARAIIGVVDLIPFAPSGLSKPAEEANRRMEERKARKESSSKSFTQRAKDLSISEDESMDEDSEYEEYEEGESDDSQEEVQFLFVDPILVYCVLTASSVFLDKITTEYNEAIQRQGLSMDIEMENSPVKVYLSTISVIQEFKRTLHAFDKLSLVSALSTYYKYLMLECLMKLKHLVIDVSGLRETPLPLKIIRGFEEPMENSERDPEVRDNSKPRVGPRDRYGSKSVLIITSEEMLSGLNEENRNTEKDNDNPNSNGPKIQQASSDASLSPPSVVSPNNSPDSNAVPQQSSTQTMPGVIPAVYNNPNNNNGLLAEDDSYRHGGGINVTAPQQPPTSSQQMYTSVLNSTSAHIRMAQQLLSAQQRALKTRERSAAALNVVPVLSLTASQPYTNMQNGNMDVSTNEQQYPTTNYRQVPHGPDMFSFSSPISSEGAVAEASGGFHPAVTQSHLQQYSNMQMSQPNMQTIQQSPMFAQQQPPQQHSTFVNVMLHSQPTTQYLSPQQYQHQPQSGGGGGSFNQSFPVQQHFDSQPGYIQPAMTNSTPHLTPLDFHATGSTNVTNATFGHQQGLPSYFADSVFGTLLEPYMDVTQFAGDGAQHHQQMPNQQHREWGGGM